ncbi:hypothetical protein [Nocardia sp. XZ_19_231]|uniref:hypothetical protein n=1 Tax=Nocardia sp. XZ_19_231 TaxID=2769252 RepID=UPI00188F4357|nr:hypothetical protein [Nocardia sp. XZ_19_231]
MAFPGGVPTSGASLDPTVLELMRGSALAPMLDQPVSQALTSMGLPQLPQLPQFVGLPEMPPLPTIDLTALMQPLTQLASAFGTGQLGGTGTGDGTSVDPTDMLSNVSSTLQTVMSLGSTALQTVMSLWQSAGSSEAATKATAAQADGAKLATQSTQEKSVLVGAAGSVATGAAQLSAVIARYSATLALAPLYALTPVGQGVLVAATIESMTEALAITAKTKVELLGHSGQMAKAGEKVEITNAPTGVDSSESLSQLMSMITPLISTASTAVQSVSSMAEQAKSLSATTAATTTDASTTGDAPLGADAEGLGSAGGGGGGGMGAIGGIGGIGAAAATPLSPWQGGRGSGLSTVGTTGAAGASGAPATGGNATTTSSSPGYMPMGGAGGGAGMPMARAVDGGGNEAVHSQLVTGNHGDEVVGQIEGVSMPVVGAAEPATTEAPPDRELTL